VLLIGSESQGLSDHLIEASDFAVRIPMVGRCDSINAAVAAEGSRVPSKTTNTYLQGAVRTYVFGFPQASLALSRAALEQALKENLARQLSADFIKF
jgi:hypothetical protein